MVREKPNPSNAAVVEKDEFGVHFKIYHPEK